MATPWEVIQFWCTIIVLIEIGALACIGASAVIHKLVED